MCAESSLDDLLNLVEMNHQLACDPEAGGCGKLNYIHHILSSPPHVFTTGDLEMSGQVISAVSFMETHIDGCAWSLQFWVGRIHVRVPMT